MEPEPASLSGYSATSSIFSSVCENFKKVQEFGWFLPAPDSGNKHYFTQKDGDLKYKQAAVLFLLANINDSLHVLMTKRSNSIRTHKGEECLPGGGREPTETSPVQTALREAQEETGLDPRLVTVLAVAPPFSTFMRTLTAVTPVVCVLNTNPKNLILTPCENEVDCSYWIPVANFLDSKNMEMVRFKAAMYHSTGAGFHFDSSTTGQHHFVWGLTARICITLSAIALNKAPAFPYSENLALSSVWTDGQRLGVVHHCVALTTKHREEWKDYRKTNSNIMPFDKWTNFTYTNKSKL